MQAKAPDIQAPFVMKNIHTIIEKRERRTSIICSNTMKRYQLICILICISITLCGCQISKTSGEAKLKLTEEEIKVLCDTYPNPERIKNNQLFDYQIEGLQQLRAGMTYLEEKYPENTFVITQFSPVSEFNKWATIQFHNENDKTIYHMTVTPNDNKFICADDYYSALIRSQYDQSIMETLHKRGYTALSYTWFQELVGKEIGIETTIEELLESKIKPTSITHLYIKNCDDKDMLTDLIRKCLFDAGYYGSFTIYFAPSLDNDIEWLESNRKEMEYTTFNCF